MKEVKMLRRQAIVFAGLAAGALLVSQPGGGRTAAKEETVTLTITGMT